MLLGIRRQFGRISSSDSLDHTRDPKPVLRIKRLIRISYTNHFSGAFFEGGSGGTPHSGNPFGRGILIESQSSLPLARNF